MGLGFTSAGLSLAVPSRAPRRHELFSSAAGVENETPSRFTLCKRASFAQSAYTSQGTQGKEMYFQTFGEDR